MRSAIRREFSHGISLGWGGLAKEPAQIKEMLVRGRALLQLDCPPFLNKINDRE